MKLIKAKVQNFRSAEDTGEFAVDQITSLVGKNEAGKTAILLALTSLNPHPSTSYILDRERDYPRRHLVNYKIRHPKEEAVAVTTFWQLEDSELAEVHAEFGDAVFSSTIVQVARHYNTASLNWKLELNYVGAFEHLFDDLGLDAAERKPLKTAEISNELIKTLKEMGEPTERHKALLAKMEKYVSITNGVTKIIEKFLPKFMYFSLYDRMKGAIHIDSTIELIRNQQIQQDGYRGQKLFSEFLDYAGVSLNEIISVTTYETFNARLQAASNNITDQVLEYWTQNPDLSVEVRIEQARPGDAPPFNNGTIARARINNQLHRVDTPFSERSAGFVWFFSFLVKFARIKDDTNQVILLLDEPGLTLHGKAQGDLLRFFDEKLAPYHQIIYSTHSPFMVMPDRLMSSRIVEDQVEIKNNRRVPIGTKVREDVLKHDPDTLFPLQGALGYEVSQSLFVGRNTLLVEGPGDILFLQAFSEALRAQQRTSLDPRWTMCPAGGIDKIRPFVALFGGNSLNVAVLSDQGTGDRRKVEDLRRSDVLKAGHFYTIIDFVDKPEADIEDIFEADLYVEILNACYTIPASDRITAVSLDAADPQTVRLVKKAEALFRVLPATIAEFDHFAPAAWLIRNPKLLDGKKASVKKTLDRAEKIFEKFNSLLL
ncbi:hypothetical protein SAE02_67520 [Skermanella aerolata]|uniref:Endonuclease GajA/Old nuclease/RecF-like AAA domain-containing protein n=1 Tax=Skermanella aerolata TaxID=393310 RepID=A0A512E1K9_9PROT|nr:AAA family ATPase [Skermanella aerolata]GEO42604.1 hypothetical protein SAE02_67520 [Skermanella aerolata]